MIDVYYYSPVLARVVRASYTYEVLSMWREEPVCLFILDHTTQEVLYMRAQ